jgi:predicted Fe-S protein YdhL (DUF1289 family)
MTDNHATVTSPCIGHCCLDDNDQCLGCFRQLQDILDWTKVTDEQRLSIINQCNQRKQQKLAN